MSPSISITQLPEQLCEDVIEAGWRMSQEGSVVTPSFQRRSARHRAEPLAAASPDRKERNGLTAC